MKNQVVYEANFDYEATYERLVRSGIAAVDETGKGLIWVRFKGTKTVFLLSPNGKIQVKWTSPEEKKVLLKILRNLLVPVVGQELTIKPTKQQLFIEYPPPPNFKIYWCEAETEYVKQAEFSPQLKEAVRAAVERQRRELKFLREPTVKEVASAVGKTPEAVRPALYEAAPELGWVEQEEGEVEREAENAINLAGWLKWLKKGEQNSELAKMAEDALKAAPQHTLEMAKRILENSPEIVPEAKPSTSSPWHYAAAGLEWNNETLKAWRRIFKSKPPAPHRSTLWVIPRRY